VPARNRTALFIAAALAFAALELLFAAKNHLLLGDYRAFYCGGAALLHGQDPYAAASLYGCERSAQPFGLYRALPGIAVPAPLPGYALLLFVPFAALPYAVSGALWLALLFVSCAVCAVTLARLTESGLAAAVAVFAIGFGIAVLPYGELASIAVAGLLVMAWALRRGAWYRAAIAGALGAILPHVGLPALLGVFIAKRQMRLPLIAIGIVLAALDVAAGGFNTALHYFTGVLPAHALSEVGSTTQYGLTWVLHALGAADKAAIGGGEISYLCMMAAGIAVAIVLSRRFNDDACLALIPPGFAVFGGSFIHYSEILAALPPAVLLLRYLRGNLRATVIAAMLLLAFPWTGVLSEPLLIIVYALAAAVLMWAFTQCEFGTALRVALAAAALTALIVVAGAHFGPAVPAHAQGGAVDSSLAQASWSEYVRTQRASTGIIWWIAKMPTWIGLALLTLSGANAVAKKDLVAPVAIEQMPIRP
jgi:hypothetical protein